MNGFRQLKADEIEIRVGAVTEKGCSLLLYKDARVDMNILDETVGGENWQREHYECKGNLFCRVGIRQEGAEWVWKADCGAESYTEKEKGEASDSFKRACFNWGIGRELYTSPFLWVSEKNCKLIKKGDKWTTYDKFEVEKIVYMNDEIIGLSIRNVTQKKRVIIWQKEGVLEK